MATDENTKQSRRAKRRAEQSATPDEALEAMGEDAERDPSGAQADETDPDAEEVGEASAEAPLPTKKKKKKRDIEVDDADPGAIKDRNKRLRAAAARKRRSSREEERETAAAQGLDASEMMDDALTRGSHAATNWLKRNLGALQWVVVLGIAGGIGWQIYSWRQTKTREKTSDHLMVAVEAEDGRVGEGAPPQDESEDPRPSFKTHAERLAAAEEGYRKAADDHKGTGAGILAELGLAGVLYDVGKLDDAKGYYEGVLGSALAKADEDVRMRATEGIAFVLEAKGDAAGALAKFKELEASESSGFQALSLYHQARLSYAEGKLDAAKTLLTKVQEKLDKERSPFGAASYLERVSRELMGAVDPTTVKPPPPPSGYSPEQLDAMKEQILKDPTKLQEMLKEMQQGVKDLTDQIPTALPDEPSPPEGLTPVPETPPAPKAPAPKAPAPKAPAPEAPPAP